MPSSPRRTSSAAKCPSPQSRWGRGAPPFNAGSGRDSTQLPWEGQSRGLRQVSQFQFRVALQQRDRVPRPQQGQRCRWSRSAGRRGEHRRGIENLVLRLARGSILLAPLLQSHWFLRSIPSPDRGHPQDAVKKSSRPVGQPVSGVSFNTGAALHDALDIPGSRSWRAGGGSHWR